MRGFITGLFLLFIFTPTAYSADITPSHVYQKTELLRLTLQKQGLIDTQRYENEKKDKALRHPRHVMQKVRECHTILSKLLTNKGIKAEPLPDLFSVREVRPADVLNGVDHLLAEIQRLDKNIKVAPPALQPGKVPDDVYNNLKKICAATRADITSSDVFQAAQAVNINLNKLAKIREYDIDIPYHSYQGKIPADVYKEAWQFLKDLRLLTLNPDYAIPGGVILPNEIPNKDVLPKDVIALMNDALAETAAMKYSLGVREHITLPEVKEGKTPSDVFSQVNRAHRVIQFLLREEAKE